MATAGSWPAPRCGGGAAARPRSSRSCCAAIRRRTASLIDTDREYEWDVLRAVEGRARVARPLYFDGTGERLGTRAIVLEHSTGRVDAAPHRPPR